MSQSISITGRPAIDELDIAVSAQPARQALCENAHPSPCAKASLSPNVVSNADPSHAVGLLGARGEQPRRRSAEQDGELAPSEIHLLPRLRRRICPKRLSVK